MTPFLSPADSGQRLWLLLVHALAFLVSLLCVALPAFAESPDLLWMRSSDSGGQIASITGGAANRILTFKRGNGNEGLKLYDATSGALLQVMAGPSSGFSGAAMSPDGKWIAAAGGGLDIAVPQIRIYRASDGGLDKIIQGGGGGSFNNIFCHIAFSPDSSLVSSTCGEGINGINVPRFGSGNVYRIADAVLVRSNAKGYFGFTPDGQSLIGVYTDSSGDYLALEKISDGSMRVFNYPPPVPAAVLVDNSNTVGQLNAGTSRLAEVSPDGTLIAWTSAGFFRVLPVSVACAPVDLHLQTPACTSAQTPLVQVNISATMRRYPNGAYGVLMIETGVPAMAVNSLAFSPDGTQLAIGGMLPVSPQGTQMTPVVKARVWNVADWTIRSEMSGIPQFGTDSDQASVAWADNTRLVTSTAYSINVFDSSTGALLREVTLGKGSPRSLAYSPDGQMLAVSRSSAYHGNGLFDGRVFLLDAASGAVLRSMVHTRAAGSACGNYSSAVVFSPDGQRLASSCEYFATDGGLRLWDPQTGALIASNDAVRPRGVPVYSLDGQKLYVSDQKDNVIRILKASDLTDLGTLGPVAGFIGSGPSIVLSPDGPLLLAARLNAAGNGYFLDLYRTSDGTTARTITLGTGNFSHLAFTSDGTGILAAGSIYSVATGAVVRSSFCSTGTPSTAVVVGDYAMCSYNAGPGGIAIKRIADGVQVKLWQDGTTLSPPMAMASNGNRISWAMGDGAIVTALNNFTTTTQATTTTTTAISTTSTSQTSTTTTAVASTTTTTLAGTGATLNLASGWNLVGNSSSSALNAASAFGDGTKVTTVWKWIASGAKWAFYAPSLAGQALIDYATGKGYDVLDTINGGEGFWVNAKTAFTASLPAGAAISAASFQGLASGWSLISVGDSPTPSGFNKTLSVTPPAAGDIPINLTTLWAWDTTLANWYFYAPSLEKSGGLSSYVSSKSYLDFGSKALAPATGFWVNRP